MATAPQAITVGYEDDGQDNQNLPEELQNALRGLVQHYMGVEKWPRRQEVMLARMQRFYERGDQHIYWNARNWVFAQAVGGASIQMDESSVDMPHYVNDYNIYGPYERSLVAVLSQNPPGVNFDPDDPSASTDIDAAKAAEKFRHHVDKYNPRKELQSSIVRLFCTDGRVILWTRGEQNASKFGYNDDHQPKYGESIDTYGVLESKVPLTLNCMTDWPYAALCFETDITVSKHKYEFAAKKIQEGSGTLGESTYERYARLGVLQGTRSLIQVAESFKHLVTNNVVWLRPCAYEAAAKEMKDELTRIFPDGVRVTFVGGAYCGAVAESMDDHLAVAHPLPGDGQNRPSLLKAVVPIQDTFNDLMNLAKEIYDYCVPSTWIRSGGIDSESIQEQVSEPGTYRTIEVPQGLRTEDCFYQEVAPTVPGDMQNAIQNLQGQLAQFVTGALPALFGGDMEDQKTASGYAMAREQAMGQMGLPWGAMQELYARAYQHAVKCAAKNRDDNQKISVQVPGKRGVTTEEITIRELAEGNFRTKPDTDTSFPETTAGKRQAFMQLMAEAATNPLLAQVLWLPANQELGKQLAGLEDLEMPGAESRDKQLQEIEELVKTKPIPPDPMAVQQFAQDSATAKSQLETGQMVTVPPPNPPGPQPSVAVDPDFDNHQFEYEVCVDWLNSAERREQNQLGNQAGVENVKLHALEHKKYLQPELPMAPPPNVPRGTSKAAPQTSPAGAPPTQVPAAQGLM